MRSLSDVSLAEILPSNLLKDPFVAALVEVFDEEFHLLVEDTEKIKIMAGVSSQTHEVLDELAWQFSVDFYDQNLDLAAKRALIASAIYWHSVKGTPRAIERVIEIAFGEGTVEEWFEYGGDPYHFRIVSEGGKFPTAQRYEDLLRLVRVVKRATAIFESMRIEQTATGSIFIGGAMHIGTHITLGSA